MITQLCKIYSPGRKYVAEGEMENPHRKWPTQVYPRCEYGWRMNTVSEVSYGGMIQQWIFGLSILDYGKLMLKDNLGQKINSS